jgi:aspartate aminotransferase
VRVSRVCLRASILQPGRRALIASTYADLSSYKRNRDALYNGLTQIGYRCVLPDGAFLSLCSGPNATGRFCRAASVEILIVSGRSSAAGLRVRHFLLVSYETIVNALPGFRRIFAQVCNN